jgi:ABC-type multidrug transport system ATPase subunit
VNLSIRKHEVFAVLGHNGAGKTTAINMITGML